MIGCLDEEALPHPPNLVRHPLLVLKRADVSDDRVREHKIELPIRVAGQVARISDNRLKRRLGILIVDIQKLDLHVTERRDIDRAPVFEQPTNVQDCDGPRYQRKKPNEQLVPTDGEP